MKKSTLVLLLSAGAFCANAQTTLLSEGFESSVPPANWTADNPDGLTTFAKTSPGKSGSSSAFCDIWNSDANGGEQGQLDALITPAVNLTTVTSPSLDVYYAFQMYSDPASYTNTDAFSIYISTDGGSSWTSIYSNSGVALVTATPQFNSGTGFVPTASDWAVANIDLSAHASASSAMFKFEFLNDWENNFYIDDVLIKGTGGGSVNEIDLSSFIHVYPAPTSGPVNISVSSGDFGSTNVSVYNTLGEKVMETNENITSNRVLKYDLSDLANGTYVITLRTENGIATSKVLLNK